MNNYGSNQLNKFPVKTKQALEECVDLYANYITCNECITEWTRSHEKDIFNLYDKLRACPELDNENNSLWLFPIPKWLLQQLQLVCTNHQVYIAHLEKDKTNKLLEMNNKEEEENNIK